MAKKRATDNPSVATRFKKGESGNPHGRPRSKRAASHRERARRFLKSKVVARDGDKRRSLTTEEAAWHKLRIEALNGSMPALRKLLELSEEVDDVEDDAPPQTELSAEEREILKRYLERTEKEDEEPTE